MRTKHYTIEQLVMFIDAAYAVIASDNRHLSQEELASLAIDATELIACIENKNLSGAITHINNITLDANGTSIAGNQYSDAFVRMWLKLMICAPCDVEDLLNQSLMGDMVIRQMAVDSFRDFILEENMTEALNNDDELNKLRAANLHRLCSKIELVRATIKEIEHITEQGILE